MKNNARSDFVLFLEGGHTISRILTAFLLIDFNFFISLHELNTVKSKITSNILVST